MYFNKFIVKVKIKLWSKLVRYTRHKRFYPFIYRSYWHYLFHKKGEQVNHNCYFAARPNPGAGIGHQIANWIAGYWFAQQFNLKFAHIAFSSNKWEQFLGFGQGEKTVQELKAQGYRMRRIPLFSEDNPIEVVRTNKIIKSYRGRKVIFLCEQDQFYRNQYGVMKEIQQKFYSAPKRKNEHLVYNSEHFNIAIHVRRGDIMAEPNNPNLQMRYMSNTYFKTVLEQVLNNFNSEKPRHIYFFSQGKPEDYPEFKSFENLHWCLEMEPQESFLHMVYADVLITSKSSFSYKPALLNRNIKVCPQNFWHGYPGTKDWILVDKDGKLLNNMKIS